MIREIVKVPDKMLRKVSVNVVDFGADLQNLIDDMIETMLELDGVGLAAVQIGELKNVIIAIDDRSEDIIVIVNPVIKSTSRGEGWLVEGCLSEPSLQVMVSRPKLIFVGGQDRNGNDIGTLRLTGFAARVIHHEIEHLNGILLEDHVRDNTGTEDV